jgi:uncharacterized protein YwgA
MANQEHMAFDRRDWLLLLLALREATAPLDPVRLQSGMFALSHNAGLAREHRYEFELVDTGPFSPLVQSDLGQLEEAGFVARHLIAGYTWSEFTATDEGMDRAKLLVAGMSESQLDALRELAEVKHELLRLGFRDLMDHLARNYPEPARKSVHI